MICQHPSEIVTSQTGITPINGKIKWHLEEDRLTQDMDKYKILFGIEQAFLKWQPYMNPIFEATNDITEAAIVFRFRTNGDNDLPSAFGQNTLAYAYFPWGTSLGRHSDVYMNDALNWQDIHKAGSVNLFKVVVHELGHAFGLDHSSTPDKDIMDPIYTPDDEVIITQDTIDGIIKLYGEKTVPVIPPKGCNILAGITIKELSKLKETSIISILTKLGIEASVKDLKKNSVQKLYDISNEV